MSALNQLFKHTFIYGLATVIPRLLTVLLTWVLTHYLDSKADFGIISLVFSWVILANVVLTYGMETAFFRFYNVDHGKEKTQSTAIIALLATTVVACLILVLLANPIASLTNIKVVYWYYVIGILCFDTLTVIPFAIMRATARTKKYAVIKFVNTLIAASLVVTFLILLPDLGKAITPDKVSQYWIALITASFITFLLVSKPYFNKWQFDAALFKKMRQYGFPVLLAGLAFAINETADKLILDWILPESIAKEQVALYSGCYRIAIGMTLFATAFKLGVEPFFFSESSKANATTTYSQITKAFVIIGSVVLFFYMFLIDFIWPFLVPESYLEALDVVPWVLVAFLFFGIYQSMSVWYKVTDKTRYGAYISLIGATLTIAMNIIFIPFLGYIASAITTCVVYGTMMIISFLWSRKHLAVPYETKTLLLYLIITIAFTFILYFIIRKEYGSGSLIYYILGTFMALILIGIIGYKEQRFFKGLLKKS